MLQSGLTKLLALSDSYLLSNTKKHERSNVYRLCIDIKEGRVFHYFDSNKGRHTVTSGNQQSAHVLIASRSTEEGALPSCNALIMC